MSIVLIEGFDVYPSLFDSSNGMQAYWALSYSHGQQSLVAGRFGGQAYQAIGYFNEETGFAQKPFTSTSTASFGCATRVDFYDPRQLNASFLSFQINGLGGTQVCGVGINTVQQYYFWVGDPNTQVVASPMIMSVDSWHYLELELNIATSGGHMNMYIDGVLQATYSGNTGAASINTVMLGFQYGQPLVGGSPTQTFDDLYVSNVATRVGERKVVTSVPTSDSSVTWTPETGSSNWAMVNQLPASATGNTYVYSTTAGNIDLYGHSPLPGTPTAISAVQVRVCADKSDSETRLIATKLSSGGNVVTGNSVGLTNSYLYYTTITELDPATSAAWTASGVDNSLIGQEMVS